MHLCVYCFKTTSTIVHIEMQAVGNNNMKTEIFTCFYKRDVNGIRTSYIFIY